jgi:hypothetical protein
MMGSMMILNLQKWPAVPLRRQVVMRRIICASNWR